MKRFKCGTTHFTRVQLSLPFKVRKLVMRWESANRIPLWYSIRLSLFKKNSVRFPLPKDEKESYGDII